MIGWNEWFLMFGTGTAAGLAVVTGVVGLQVAADKIARRKRIPQIPGRHAAGLAPGTDSQRRAVTMAQADWSETTTQAMPVHEGLPIASPPSRVGAALTALSEVLRLPTWEPGASEEWSPLPHGPLEPDEWEPGASEEWSPLATYGDDPQSDDPVGDGGQEPRLAGAAIAILKRPIAGRPQVYHLDRGDGTAGCVSAAAGHVQLDPSSRIQPAEAEVERRCMRSGCREYWPEVTRGDQAVAD